MASSGDIHAAGLGSSDHTVPGASNSTEVSELLTSLNLQQYIGVFAANDINNISTLNEMQDAHFHMLDVSIGHQLDIVKLARSRSESPLVRVGSSPNCNAVVNQGRQVNNFVLHSTVAPVLNQFRAPRNFDPVSPLSIDGSQEEAIDQRANAGKAKRRINANLVPFERATTAQSRHSVAAKPATSSSDGHRSDAIDMVNRQAKAEMTGKAYKAARPRLQDNERSGQQHAAPQYKTSACRSHWDDSLSSVQQDAVQIPQKSRTALAQVAPIAVKISVNAHLKAFKAAFVRTLKLIAIELGSLHPVGNCEKVITRVVLHVDVAFGIQLTDVNTVYNYCESAICNLHIIIYRSIISNGIAALCELVDLPDNVTGLSTVQYRAVVKQTVTNSYTPIMKEAASSTEVCAVEIGMGAKQMTHACVHAAMPWMFSMARNAARLSQNTARAALTDRDPKHKMEEAARALLSAEPLPDCFTSESIRQLLQRTVTRAFQSWRTLTM